MNDRRCPGCGADTSAQARFCEGCGADLATPDAPTEVMPEPDPLAGVPLTADAPVDTDAATSVIDGPHAGDMEEGPVEDLLRDALAPNYLLLHRLGQGGMGSVFLAREPALKRLVAVKVMARSLTGDEQARARFQREAEAVAAISHPNVVGIYVVGALADGTPYFVMEYVAGRSMEQRLREDGPLDGEEASRVMGEVAAALQAAHAKGIVHRDIKPANVLCEDETGRTVVSDFGIASMQATADDDVAGLTATGTSIGTPRYMSPEQLMGQPVTDRSDIYSLGLTAYEMVTGTGPYSANSHGELIAAHLRDEPRPITDLREDLSPMLAQMIEEMMAKDPALRPSAGNIVERVRPTGHAIMEWPPPGMERLAGGLRRVSKALGVGSAAFVIPLLWILSRGPDPNAAMFALPTWVVAAGVLIGFIAFGAASVWIVLAAWRLRRALMAGYGWGTVLEVMADTRGDTGNLIVGAAEYRRLRTGNREDLRHGRIRREVLYFISALALVPFLVLFVILAWNGLIPESAAVPFVVVPSLVMWVGGLGSGWSESRMVTRSRHDRQVEVTPREQQELTATWYSTFETARKGQTLGRGGSGGRYFGVVGGGAAVLILLTTVVLVAPVLVSTALGRTMWIIVMPNLTDTVERFRLVEVGRRYRLEGSTVSPLEAGTAAWRLSNVGEDAPDQPWVRPPADPIRAPWLPEGDADPFDADWREIDFFEAARNGFSDAQRAAIRTVETHPGFEDWRTVARARVADLWEPVLVRPLPDDVNMFALPVPRFLSWREGARGRLAVAALYAEAGDWEVADTLVREVISAGVTLADNSTSLISALVGRALVETGLEGLASLYQLEGREGEARAIEQSRDSVIAIVEAVTAATDRVLRGGVPETDMIRRHAMSLIEDDTMARSVRWEMITLLVFAPCTNPHELIFGMDDASAAAIAEAAASLVRSPSEAELYRVAVENVERVGRGGFEVSGLFAPVRAISRLLGNPRLTACLSISFASSM